MLSKSRYLDHFSDSSDDDSHKLTKRVKKLKAQNKKLTKKVKVLKKKLKDAKKTKPKDDNSSSSSKRFL